MGMRGEGPRPGHLAVPAQRPGREALGAGRRACFTYQGLRFATSHSSKLNTYPRPDPRPVPTPDSVFISADRRVPICETGGAEVRGKGSLSGDCPSRWWPRAEGALSSPRLPALWLSPKLREMRVDLGFWGPKFLEQEEREKK